MKPILLLTTFLVICGLGLGTARAEEPWTLFDGKHWSFPKLHEQWQQRKCWCADDYHAKQLPCVSPHVKGCVDDYCRKELPCVSPNAKGSVDDYCPKPCPLLLWRCCGPNCTCGPPDASCGPCSRAKKHFLCLP